MIPKQENADKSENQAGGLQLPPISSNRLKSIHPLKTEKMKKYRCTVCEWIYDPQVGDPDGGIAPGTSFEEIPEDWVCPVCGVGKDQFEEVEE